MQQETKKFLVILKSQPREPSSTAITSPDIKLEDATKIHRIQVKKELKKENQNEDDDDSDVNDQDYTQRMSQIINKLLSKNKVSTKNAFQVPIVDVSQLKSYQGSDESSWSKISTTLQNCSKIYAYRVDCVTQKISKMSTSIARNTRQELECKEVTKEISQSEILLDAQSYKLTSMKNIGLHLDTQKLDKECLIIQVQNPNNVKFRRMMDQNGVSGLILATVPLSKSFAVQLQPYFDSSIKMEVEKSFKFEQPLPKQQLNWETIERITKVTAFETHKIEEEPENTIQAFLESMEQTKIELNEGSYFSKDEEVTGYLQPQQAYNEETKADTQVFYFRNKRKYEVKRSRLKLKKDKIIKSVSKELGCCFDFSQPLSKQNVLKTDQTLANRKFPVKESSRSNLVSFVSPHRIKRMKKMLAASMGEQYSISDMDLNQRVGEMLDEAQPSSYQNQRTEKEQRQTGAKYPSVKQTKVELTNLLSGIDQILFSQLFNFHRQRVGNPYETIDFLSVLHLTNEKGFVLKEVNEFDFMISKSIA